MASFFGLGQTGQQKAYTADKTRFTNQNGVLYNQTGGRVNSDYQGTENQIGSYLQKANQMTSPTSVPAYRQNFENSMGASQAMISGLAANPGYTPGEAQATRMAATAPVSAAYRTATANNAATAARTGNQQGVLGANLAAARGRGMDMAQAGAGAEDQIANARIAGDQFATNAQMQQGQNWQGAKQNEVSNLPQLYQLPMAAQGSQADTGLQSQLQMLGMDAGIAGQISQQAIANPGFMQRFTAAMAGLVPKAAGGM